MMRRPVANPHRRENDFLPTRQITENLGELCCYESASFSDTLDPTGSYLLLWLNSTWVAFEDGELLIKRSVNE